MAEEFSLLSVRLRSTELDWVETPACRRCDCVTASSAVEEKRSHRCDWVTHHLGTAVMTNLFAFALAARTAAAATVAYNCF